MKLKITLILLVLLCGLTGEAQTFEYDWTSARGSSTTFTYPYSCGSWSTCWATSYPQFYTNDLTADQQGNNVRLISYDRPFDYDPGDGVVNMPSAMNGNFYASNNILAKHDSQNNVLWAGYIIRSQSGGVFAIRRTAALSNGDVIAVGQFYGSCSPTLNNGGGDVMVTNNSTYDGFIVCYDGNSGAIKWKKQIGGPGTESVNNVTIDSNNNIIVTGSGTVSSDLDPGPGVANPAANFFTAKYNSAGDFILSLSKNADAGVATDQAGNVYEYGYYSGTVDLDGTSNVQNFTSSAPALYVSKYTPNGSYLWTKEIKGTSSVYPTGFVAKGDQLYISGYTYNTQPLDLDPGAGVVALPSVNANQSFVVQWNTDGVYQWHYGQTVIGVGVLIDANQDNELLIANPNATQVDTDVDPGSGTATVPATNKYWMKFDANHNLVAYNWFKVNQLAFAKLDYNSGVLISGRSDYAAYLDSANPTTNTNAGQTSESYNFFVGRYRVSCTGTTPPPTGNAAQSFCLSAEPTLAQLQATGTQIQWYATQTGGSPLALDTALQNNEVYYASQTVAPCESDLRLAVTVSLTAPAAPVSNAQTFCEAPTVSQLAATGENLQWFAQAEGGAALAGSASVQTGTYYVSQTVSGCESARTSVEISVGTGGANQWYADSDGDGYGNLLDTYFGCAQPGYVLDNTDCNDNDENVHQTFAFYPDTDGDGYGAAQSEMVCAANAQTPPSGYVTNNTDCDDNNPNVYQTAMLYVDFDGDGYSSNETQMVCYGQQIPAGYLASATILDCNDSVAAIHPNGVEILYNGVDDNCDGNLDEGHQIKTKLLNSFCAATLTSMSSVIGITTLAPAAAYTRWRVRATHGAQVQIIETAVPHFQMTQFASYAYATSYTIEIELQRNGVWLGYYGQPCVVSTPPILEEGGAASVATSQCGQTLSKINALIATNSINGVTGYRFKVTNLTDAAGPYAEQVITRGINWFTLQMLTRYNYGTTYRIEVAVKTTGDFGGYGAPCEVSSPAAPSLTQCNLTAVSNTQNIAARSVQGVTQYRFQITRAADNASTTMDRGVNYFTFNQVPSEIFTAGAEYYIRVAVMTTGYWSPFGDVCTVIAPGGTAKEGGSNAVNSAAFKATAYPNPFAAAFKLELTGASQDEVSVKVYDMLGKLVAREAFAAAEITSGQMGANLPSGVYNVVVSQGENLRSLRVIKR